MGKRYGQHFLRSPSVLDRIVAAAAPDPEEPVLEIGPGEGALTGRLLARGARLTAVEIDPLLCERLRARFGAAPRFRLIEGDVLEAALEPDALFGAPAPYAVIANLPYYLSSPLLFRLIAERRHLTRLVLMVQREIAQRLVARPADGKAYGALSIAGQHAFALRRLFEVPRGAFRPPPKVESAVVEFRPRDPLLPEPEERRFLEYVKRLFSQRRKLMRSTLRRECPALDPARWAELERFIGRRPEALSPDEHLMVFRIAAKIKGSTTAEGPPWHYQAKT
jgi:16S rRNA (adenine1518-N6/adenine1519-N6)-dimethyltransferase